MAELPSGTVTFLFTDIEGSTRMLHELRERYGDVLAAHARILRAAIAAHDGREIDTQGDSFFVAFRTAKDALAAAVEAQRNLAEEPSLLGARPSVRMGVHTGEPSVTGERYIGLAVHRAARICAAARGGQILLSGTTRDLVADELPAGASLRDLGEHKLKDFDRPERVFQLSVDGLQDEFPALETEAGSAQLEAFRGREGELVDAAAVAVAARGWPLRRLLSTRAALAVIVVALVLAATIVAVLAATGRSGGPNPSAGVQAKSVAVIDPTDDAVAEAINLDASPTMLAGESDDLWIADEVDKAVLRVDARTRDFVRTIGLGAAPGGLTTAAGSVWVTSDGFGSRPLLEVVPATDDVKAGPRPRCCPGLSFITGDDRQLWMANAVGADVVRFDPASRRFAPVLCCSVVVDAMALGEGALWVVEREDQQVLRLDPDTGTVQATIPIGAPPLQPLTFRHPEVQTALAAGEGGVWAVDAVEGLVWQINPVQNSVERTIAVGAGAKGVAVGLGSVWVANNVSGVVLRIDPSSGHVTKRIKVASHIGGIAVAGGAVWVGIP